MTLHIPLNIILLSKHLSVVTDKPSQASKPQRPRSGGKPAAAKLIKQVKARSKRADFLRYFLASPNGRTAAQCVKKFGMSRQNVFSYWSAINREHGIGYTLAEDSIIPLLPPKHSTKTIFRSQ